jgi:large subunit ribosomal protein L10
MSKTQVAPRKLEIVANLKKHLEAHNTIGIVEMEGIGAKTVQKLRADLRGKAKIIGAKNTLMRKALDETKVKNAEKLKEFVKGSVAFLFTNDSPYSIGSYLAKNKVQAPAKAGQISPIDVVVPKLNTGMPPGTIISELNAVGLPTRIEGGTVAVPQDTQVLSPGDRISSTLASILTRLGIEPFFVGLSLDVVLEEGEIIDGADLVLDFDVIRDELIHAHQSAVALSLGAGILTSETAPQVLASVYSKALAVAAEIGWITEETAPRVFGLANARAMALAKALRAVDPSAVPAEI